MGFLTTLSVRETSQRLRYLRAPGKPNTLPAQRTRAREPQGRQAETLESEERLSRHTLQILKTHAFPVSCLQHYFRSINSHTQNPTL